MTMFASHAPGEVIDAIRPDLEAFTSLWTALRVNYEGTNITRTVARLLHMYQPEEGVIAYERLLRTLFVLLEDFDSDGLQLLVSMVPPPKGVSDEVIKEVFNNATGFVRVDAPIFHKNTDHFHCTAASTSTTASTPDFSYPKSASQSYSCTAVQQSEEISVPEMNTNPNPTVPNDNNCQKNGMKKSPQIVSQESSEVFRGFPPSEIFNTQSHVQSIKNFYRPATSYAFPQSNQSFVNFGQIVGQNSGQIQQPVNTGLLGPTYRPKWLQSPYLIQKNSYPVTQYKDFYLKTVNNQYVKVPAGAGTKLKNFHPGNVNTSQPSYQTLYNNAHDYLRNRSNTVTSGLLEKIQRHRSIQEAAIKKILTECEPSKKAALSVPRVIDADRMSTSQSSVEFKIVDPKFQFENQEEKMGETSSLKKTSIVINSKTGNSAIKTCNLLFNDRAEFDAKAAGNGGNKIGVELELNGKNPAVNHENFEEFAKEVRMRQRAIQEDIYKMDVVGSDIFAEEEPGDLEEADNLIKPEILTVTEELKNSCKKFMDRVRTVESVEVPAFPKTRALSEIHEQQQAVLPPSDNESNLRRLLTSKNFAGNKVANVPQKTLEDPVILVPETNASPVEIALTKELIGSNSGKRIIRRKKSDVPSTRGKSQKTAQTGTGTSEFSEFQDESNLEDSENTTPKLETRMRNNSQSVESTTRCPLSTASQTASASVGPATTMAELAAYKKQYYDALLSIQKAKAAVANSLAISSVGNSPGLINPYYYNYLQQQHHQILQRHQHQMLMGHRFPQHQSLPAGAPWFRTSDWRYMPRRPQMLHPSSSMWPSSVGYLPRDSQITAAGPQRQRQLQQENVVQVSKPPVKRRKLEEIVGKLKETESNVTNN